MRGRLPVIVIATAVITTMRGRLPAIVIATAATTHHIIHVVHTDYHSLHRRQLLAAIVVVTIRHPQFCKLLGHRGSIRH